MNEVQLSDIAFLRIVVGMLGEGGINPWWCSSFFSSAGTSFLNPVFCRTTLLARYHGVCEAAALVHNRHIGVGAKVFHLFLLPDSLEREIHCLVGDERLAADFAQKMATPEVTIHLLEDMTEGFSVVASGPVRLGSESRLYKVAAWQKAAAHYLHGFREGIPVFPFFSGK